MTDIEILNKMKEITYGWVDVDGNKHIDVDETYATLYRLQAQSICLFLNVVFVGIKWSLKDIIFLFQIMNSKHI